MIVRLCLLCGPIAAQTAAGPNPTSTEIKSNLKEILNQSEFQPESAQRSPLAGWLDKARAQLQSWWDTLREWWNKILNFFRRLFGGGRGSLGTVNVALVYTVIAGLAVLATLSLARILREHGGIRLRKKNEMRAVTAPEKEEERQLAPDEWIERAARCARERDFRGAFRAVFLAILVQLDRTGSIEYQRSRTNGDYLRVLRSHSPRALYELFAPLAREFDLHWYGGQPSYESDYQRCLDAYRRLPAVTGAASQASPERIIDAESQMASGGS